MHYQLDLQFQFLAKPHVKAFAVAVESVSAPGTNRPPRRQPGEETRPGDRLFLQQGLAVGCRDRLTWEGDYIFQLHQQLCCWPLAIAGGGTSGRTVLIHHSEGFFSAGIAKMLCLQRMNFLWPYSSSTLPW